MFKKFSKVFFVSLVAIAFAVSAAHAATTASLKLYEYDPFGNLINSPGQASGLDTMIINQKGYSYTGWSGPGTPSTIHSDSWQKCFRQYVGTGTWYNTDRWLQSWSVTAYIEGGWTLYHTELSKYHSMVAMVNPDGTPYTGGGFECFAGKKGLTSYSDLRTYDYAGRAPAYNYSGFSSFIIPTVWTGVRDAVSLYVRHISTNTIFEFNYGNTAYDLYGDIRVMTLNGPGLAALATGTTRSAKSGDTLVKVSENPEAASMLKKAATLGKTRAAPITIEQAKKKMETQVTAVKATEEEIKAEETISKTKQSKTTTKKASERPSRRSTKARR